MTVVPVRPQALQADLRALGLATGAVVLVHCSMRKIGWLDDGVATLASALRDAIGPTGTVVVTAQTPGNSVSSDAYRAATAGMTDAERAAYEERMPGFDAGTTPSSGVGAFAEHIRRLPGSVRSAHPQASFCAWGPEASDLMQVHELDSHLGERSPLAALERAGATTLLLGVGYESCTALHLAEYRLRRPPIMRDYRCYEMRRGRRVRVDFRAPHLDASPFARIGLGLDSEDFTRKGTVGRAPARLLPIGAAVRYAVEWMDRNLLR